MRWHDATDSQPKLGETVLCELSDKRLVLAILGVKQDPAQGNGVVGLAWMANPAIADVFPLAVAKWARVTGSDA